MQDNSPPTSLWNVPSVRKPLHILCQLYGVVVQFGGLPPAKPDTIPQTDCWSPPFLPTGSVLSKQWSDSSHCNEPSQPVKDWSPTCHVSVREMERRWRNEHSWVK
ncbi:hypothetical protein DPEC_G00137630 [Dallia pectoralis]|uniref:Uncharacterized protein n=1 Tax=Dallia pectoralis TaxID=75939 RepID=A0ACC2GM94_DALPE|nr:hypothetical protein DPEC_G00137630 [Dallia pectoralis]